MSNIEKDPNEALADEWAAALEEQDEVIPASSGMAADTAQFQELTAESKKGNGGEVQLDAILDVPVTISMEIGRTQISIRNLLQLNQARWLNWTVSPANQWMCWSMVR